MPDTHTPNLNLTKPAVGELAGRDLWGGKLNTNMDILDTFSVTMDGDLSAITGDITALQNNKEDKAKKGVMNGYAALDGAGKVPTGQLPSYVDDVVMYANLAAFPATGETGKIYVAEDTNTAYRWTGSAYVLVGGTGTASDYINVTGDTMTGPLALMAGVPANPAYATRKDYVDGAVANLQPSIDAKVEKTGDTMTGNLAIQRASPELTLAKAFGTPAKITGGLGPAVGFKARWSINLGNSVLEGGSNIGSDFAIERYDDAGAIIDNPVTMLRSTGVWNFTKTPTVNGAPLIGGATISDTPPAGPIPGQFWWESDTGGLYLRYADANSSQWVQVNPGGLQDAVSDGAAYGRLNGTWQKVLPLTGGALTGKMSVAVNIVDYAATFNNANATNGAGGVIGYVGANYGILGYVTGGTAYSLYGTGLIYVNGAIGSGGNISAAGVCQGVSLAATGAGGVTSAGPYYSSAVSNWIMNYLNQANITTGTGQWELMFGGSARFRYQSTYYCPVVDNGTYSGVSSNRWIAVYAVAGTINTSDEREKKDIRPLDEREKAAARRIKDLIVAYRWKARIAKDDRDKIYIGVIAQRIEEVLNEEGLDAEDYAMWTRDELTTHHDPEMDEDGNLISEARDEPNGEYRYSVDYNQVLAFIIGGL